MMKSHPQRFSPVSTFSPEKLKITVLMGGVSREREVSIESGTCVAEALKEAGADVASADITPNHLEILDDKSIDVFFIALHGSWGEDGQLQSILESKGLTYTGSPPKSSKLAFDKWESKKLFKKACVPTPEAALFEPKLKLWDALKYVIKPLREGSTIGITIADSPEQAIEAAKKCADEFGDCMIERFVKGMEITVGVIGSEALPIIEIRAKDGFYDYQAKYIDDKTQYLFDTIEDAGFVRRIQKSAVDCFNAVGCRGAARVDFIIGEDGVAYALEINTIPGMTNHSLLPKAAAKADISMSQLCMKIVEMAMADAATRKPAARR